MFSDVFKLIHSQAPIDKKHDWTLFEQITRNNMLILSFNKNIFKREMRHLSNDKIYSSDDFLIELKSKMRKQSLRLRRSSPFGKDFSLSESMFFNLILFETATFLLENFFFHFRSSRTRSV